MHLVGAQRIDGHAQRQRRVDAAGKPNDRALEATLADVVAHAEHQRLVGLGHQRQFVGEVGGTQQATVNIDHTEGLLELRQAHLHGAGAVEGKRAAVEYQFVLAADEVAIDGRHPGRCHTAGQYFLALLMFFKMTGRGVEDEQQFGAGFARRLSRARLPDVGTNIDAAAHAAKGDDTGFSSGVEIAFFVEHVVVGQAILAVNRNFRPIFDHGRRVVAATFMFFGVTDNERNALDAPGQIIQCPRAGPVKIRPQQQVFRGVTAQRQFGRQQHLRAARLGISGTLQDAFDIAGQVTDGGIELGDGNTQHAGKSRNR